MSLQRRAILLTLLVLAACGPTRNDRGGDDDDDVVADAGSCVKRTCGSSCGSVPDGCGGTLACAACVDGGACTGESDRALCDAHGRACGPFAATDRCGALRQIDSCGSCNGVACTAGSCGGDCVRETDLAFCRRLGKQCGSWTDFDNCENSRTVDSCGNCPSNGQCGVIGPNLCCAPESDETLCTGACGVVTKTDACGATRSIECGSCGEWTRVSIPGLTKKLYELHGSSATNVWAGGEAGALARWNGTAWYTVTVPTTSSVNGLWVNGPDDVWVAALDKSLLHWNGQGWDVAANPTPTLHFGTFSLAGARLFAFGSAGTIASLAGTTWSAVPGIPTAADYYGSWGDPSGTAWAVGPSSVITRFDGTSWQALASGYTATFTDVWGSHPGNVIVVGSINSGTGIVLRWNGTQFLETTAFGPLQGVWGASGTDVYAVGAAGRIQHWDGSSWTQQVSGVTARLNAIWGANANDVWAVGNDGIALRRKR